MFTGLTEEVGVVRRVERGTEGARLTIGARVTLEQTRLGDSIAVSGACLTVTEIGSDQFVADCMSETLKRTTLERLGRGAEVNLERSLALGDRLGGHIVLGHVDAVIEVTGIERRGDSLEMRFSLPAELAAFVAEKGSVALDGVSLTVIRAGGAEFVVGLIPHTLSSTTLRRLQKGDLVNLEVDVIARYVCQSVFAGRSREGDGAQEVGGLTIELLAEKGFA